MNDQDQSREVNRARKSEEPTRQSWYDVKRLAQAILRHPEADATRQAKQIISIADSHLEK
jgi:hypothetical protein